MAFISNLNEFDKKKKNNNFRSVRKEETPFGIAIVHFGDLGLKVSHTFGTIPLDSDELSLIVNYYSIIIQQGKKHTLYGAFPLPHHPDWEVLIYGYEVIDHTIKDSRVRKKGGKTPAFILLIYNLRLQTQFTQYRTQIQQLLDDYFLTPINIETFSITQLRILLNDILLSIKQKDIIQYTKSRYYNNKKKETIISEVVDNLTFLDVILSNTTDRALANLDLLLIHKESGVKSFFRECLPLLLERQTASSVIKIKNTNIGFTFEMKKVKLLTLFEEQLSFLIKHSTAFFKTHLTNKSRLSFVLSPSSSKIFYEPGFLKFLKAVTLKSNLNSLIISFSTEKNEPLPWYIVINKFLSSTKKWITQKNDILLISEQILKNLNYTNYNEFLLILMTEILKYQIRKIIQSLTKA